MGRIIAELQPALSRTLEIDGSIRKPAHLGEGDGKVVGNQGYVVNVPLRFVDIEDATQLTLRLLELAAPVK